jgi:hypothetical protein
MPSISISDGVSLTADAQLAPWSCLAKYAQDLPKLVTGGIDLNSWKVLTLADPAVQSLDAGVDVSEPITLSTPAPALTLGANAALHFEVLTGKLFSPDLYGDDIAIPDGQCAVRLGLSAEVSAGEKLPSGSATFGLDAHAGIAIDSYRPFPAGDGAPTVLEALQQSLGELVIPFQTEDVSSMPPGAVVTLGGSGSLKFSAKANLLAVSNPLATVALPAPIGGLAVTQGASVAIGASWEIGCQYQVRVQKLDASSVRVGWYRKHSSEFVVTATAQAGISAGTSSMNLFPRLVGAISADAKAEEDELERAGLNTAAAAAIEGAVKKAVNRKLELALTAEFGSLASDEAAFLYELNLDKMGDAAHAAVDLALHGDLSGFAEPPAGITEVRSILTRARASRFNFKINLLGIFNFSSISKLALTGTVTWTPSTGELLIVDQATAQRIQTASVNFGADEQKLRSVMAESFLITAAYRGSQSAVTPPQLKSTHSFFRLDNDTSRDELRRFSMALDAVKLSPPELPADAGSFGRTTVHLEADYDDAASLALFLNDTGQPRPVEEYESTGRLALRLLIPSDGDDAFRLQPTLDDALWARMKDLGPANFAQLFPSPQANVITSDYLTIRWWADAMHGAAILIQQILRPGTANSDALRQDLAHHLKDVASKAREQFGSPWGLVAMYRVSGARAAAAGSITGPGYVFTSERPLAAIGS